MLVRRREWWIAVAVALGSLAYYLAYARRFLDLPSLNDEGLAMYGSLRVMQGERPLVDFWAYPPGRYWLLAAAMHLFGVDVFVHRALLAALMAVKNALAYGVARRVMPRGPALAAVLTIALVPGPWHKTYYSLLMFAQLLVLMHYLDRPTARRAAWCGVAAGAAFYFRQDSAAYGLAAGAVMVSLALLPRGQWKAWLAHGFVVLGAFLLVMTPFVLLYVDAWALTLRRLGPDPVLVAEVIYQRVNFTHPAKLWRFFQMHVANWPNRWFLRGFFPYATVAVTVGALVALLPWAARLRRLRRAELAWAALVVGSLFAMMKVYKQPGVETVLMAGQGAVLLGAGAAWWLCPRKSQKQRPRRAWRPMACAAVWVALGFTWAHLLLLSVVHVPELETGALGEALRRGRTHTLQTDRATLHLRAKQAQTLAQLVAHVKTNTTPEQTIYAWQQPMLYVLCERDNPVGTDSIVPPIVLDDLADQFRDVFTHRPPAVQIIDTQSRWWRRFEEYPADLQRLVFAGYAVTADLGDYLMLERRAGEDAFSAVRARMGEAGDSADE